MSHPSKRVFAVHAPDHGIVRPTKLGRTSCDDVQDGLDLCRRAGDNAENFAGRGLLLKRLGKVAVSILQFLEQPNVLDCYDSLGGEALEELNLLF
jgi:hypothetical protein